MSLAVHNRTHRTKNKYDYTFNETLSILSVVDVNRTDLILITHKIFATILLVYCTWHRKHQVQTVTLLNIVHNLTKHVSCF